MTKEEVLKRKSDLEQGFANLSRKIDELQKKITETITMRNATVGAIGECDHWLKDIDEPKTAAPEKKKGKQEEPCQ